MIPINTCIGPHPDFFLELVLRVGALREGREGAEDGLLCKGREEETGVAAPPPLLLKEESTLRLCMIDENLID